MKHITIYLKTEKEIDLQRSVKQIIRESRRAPPSADMDMELDNSYMDAGDTIHQSDTVSGRKRIHSPIQDCDFVATSLRKLNNHDPDDLIGVTCSDSDHSDINSTQIMELEPSISIWDKALNNLPHNWERGLLYAVREINEDITRQQIQPQTHQQVLHDLDIADLSVNTVEYSKETNINDARNSVYEHLDNVNSDNDSENQSICGDSAITDSIDNNLDNIENETEKKKKNKRRGKNRIGHRTRQTKPKHKLNIN